MNVSEDFKKPGKKKQAEDVLSTCLPVWKSENRFLLQVVWHRDNAKRRYWRTDEVFQR